MNARRLSPAVAGVLNGLWFLLALGICQAESLDALVGRWPEANLRASLDPPGSMQIEQGGSFHLRVAADTEASVTLVLVSPDAKARILVPRREGTDDRVEANSELIIPDLSSGEILYADMAEGKATAYVLASSESLWPGSATSNDPWKPLQDVESRVTAALASHPGVRMAITRIPLRVVAPPMKEFVSTEEFVQFYGVATRSVTNAERGFAVQFAHNSADLTDFGKRQLDAVGRGMSDPRLAADRFAIEGHTDDVGTDEYNMDLSRRRAASVTHYLSALGVRPGRLTATAMGKKGPAVAGTSEEARAANRRVVIRRQDNVQ